MEESYKLLLKELIIKTKIASLGTCRDNIPFVSMIAYAVSKDFSEIYFHASRLAKHSQNLIKNSNVSLMICEPETLKNNPQTLVRITFTGKASIIDEELNEYENIKRIYLEKNKYASFNFQLGDFNLYRLIIEKAKLVAGFGKTFNLSNSDLIELAEE